MNAVFALSSTFRTVAWILAAMLLIGWVGYYWFNIRRARPEIGSEIELAANRGGLPEDENLEGKTLEQWQFLGVVFLLIIGLGLPIYWLREPGRQAAATRGDATWAINEGEDLYLNGFQCSSCHGADGGGGVAGFILPVPLQEPDGSFRLNEDGSIATFNVQVSWYAPRMTDVLLRYSEEEVEEILIYGRANSPMPAWGVDGGGVGTTQEITNVIAYLRSIQEDPAVVQAGHTEDLENARANAEGEFDDGEWLFKEHCARCHTPGWQWAATTSPAVLEQAQADLDAIAPGTELPIGAQGAGGFGARLSRESLERQFLTVEDQVDLISRGMNDNEAYGTRGLGNGQMPGYGQLLTQEQITAIVEYERSIEHDDDMEATE